MAIFGSDFHEFQINLSPYTDIITSCVAQEWCWLCRNTVHPMHYEIGNVLGCPGAQFSPDRRSLYLRREVVPSPVPQQPPVIRIFSDLTVDSNDANHDDGASGDVSNSCCSQSCRQEIQRAVTRIFYTLFSLLVVIMSIPFLPFTWLHYLLVRRQQSSYLLPGYTLCVLFAQLIFLPAGIIYYLYLLASCQDALGDGYAVMSLPFKTAARHWLEDGWGIGVWDWRVDGCCCSMAHTSSSPMNRSPGQGEFQSISMSARGVRRQSQQRGGNVGSTLLSVDKGVAGVYDPMDHADDIEMQSTHTSPQTVNTPSAVPTAAKTKVVADRSSDDGKCMKVIRRVPIFIVVILMLLIYYGLFLSVAVAVSVPFLPVMLAGVCCGFEHRDNFTDTIMLPGYVFWALVFQVIYLPFGLLLFIPCCIYDALWAFMWGGQQQPAGEQRTAERSEAAKPFSLIEEIKWTVFPPMLAALFISRDFMRQRGGCCPFVVPLVYAIPCVIAGLLDA
jgi:hypothetical protein